MPTLVFLLFHFGPSTPTTKVASENKLQKFFEKTIKIVFRSFLLKSYQLKKRFFDIVVKQAIKIPT